jgi:HlyD family secretion protein
MKKIRKRSLLLISFLAFGGVFLFFLLFWETQGKCQFILKNIERGEISSVITATGVVDAIATVQIGSQVSGTIEALFADFNTFVKKGQVLAEIDQKPFKNKVIQAKAKLNVAMATLGEAKAKVEITEAFLVDAERTWKRKSELLRKHVISENDFDKATTSYDMALAELKAVEARCRSVHAQVDQAGANLDMAELDLQYTTIASPVDGMIVSRNVDIGQTLIAQLQTPVLFLIARNLKEMEVHTNVSEADIGLVKEGQDCFFSVDAYPGNKFSGIVSQVRNAPINIQNVVTYDVVVRVANQELLLKPGMTANVSIVVAHKKGVLHVPNAALRFNPELAGFEVNAPGNISGNSHNLITQEMNDKRHETQLSRVWVPWNKGKLMPVTLSLGISDDIYTEVISGDIREGQKVIIGIREAREGSRRTVLGNFLSGLTGRKK